MKEIAKIYSDMGGTFVTPVDELVTKLQGINAIIFDWDGVFNNGEKSAKGGSNFSEVDSMGTNLLRYSFYLKKGSLPLTAVISGEKNDTALYFSERECFNYSFYKIKNKTDALDFICSSEQINPKQIAFFFDDVLDLPVAEVCGLRLMVNQKVNPLFANYCVKNKIVDYISANNGGNCAVREITELLIALNGNYSEVITNRKKYSDNYQSYINKRKQVKPDFLTYKEDRLERT